MIDPMSVFGLSLAYVMIAALLLALLLRTTWPGWVKLVAVLCASAFYIVSYFSLHGLTGWPSGRPVPESFRLIAAVIDEPDAIYLWLRPLDAPDAKPRSHALLYDRALHDQVRRARQRMRAGHPQMGERGPQSGAGPAAGPELRFSDLPGRQLPPKP